MPIGIGDTVTDTCQDVAGVPIKALGLGSGDVLEYATVSSSSPVATGKLLKSSRKCDYKDEFEYNGLLICNEEFCENGKITKLSVKKSPMVNAFEADPDVPENFLVDRCGNQDIVSVGGITVAEGYQWEATPGDNEGLELATSLTNHYSIEMVLKFGDNADFYAVAFESQHNILLDSVLTVTVKLNGTTLGVNTHFAAMDGFWVGKLARTNPDMPVEADPFALYFLTWGTDLFSVTEMSEAVFDFNGVNTVRAEAVWGDPNPIHVGTETFCEVAVYVLALREDQDTGDIIVVNEVYVGDLHIDGELPSSEFLEDTFSFGSLSGYIRILEVKGRGLPDVGLYLHDGSIILYPEEDDPDTVDMVENTYAHVVFTLDSSGAAKTYANGVLVSNVTDTTDAMTVSGGTIRFFMDNLVSATDEISAGTVKRIRVYNRPLTQDEVTARYNCAVSQGLL